MTLNADEVIQCFFDKLEADDEFFAYYGVDEGEALALARERARSYLKEAVVYFRRFAVVDFSFAMTESDDGDLFFEEEITDDEVDLLTEIMLLKYYERGLAKLKPKINMFSSTDLKALHSANERSTFIEMLRSVRENVDTMLSQYVARDRLTGGVKLVDHAVPEDDS